MYANIIRPAGRSTGSYPIAFLYNASVTFELSSSTGQLRRDLRDMLALVARAIKLVGAGLARAVGVGQRTGAIGRPAGDLVHVGQPRKGVGEAHDDHALVK